MLDRFIEAKKEELERLRLQEANGTLPAPLEIDRPSLKRQLQEAPSVAVVAEYKRASPSKGIINPRLGAKEAAEAYAAGGAAAISVLTEKAHFHGSLAFLERAQVAGLPLLRKDFLFHPLQIAESAATPAAAVLLIVRYFLETPGTLKTLVEQAQAYGLETVVEVFSEAEIDLARQAGADIIQVNNRDLDTLQVDLDRSYALGKRKQAGEVWISASGVNAPQHCVALGERGFDAVLVGTWLMQHKEPAAALRYLRGVGPGMAAAKSTPFFEQG